MVQSHHMHSIWCNASKYSSKLKKKKNIIMKNFVRTYCRLIAQNSCRYNCSVFLFLRQFNVIRLVFVCCHFVRFCDNDFNFHYTKYNLKNNTQKNQQANSKYFNPFKERTSDRARTATQMNWREASEKYVQNSNPTPMIR